MSTTPAPTIYSVPADLHARARVGEGMMFASKTPRDLNRDATPWVSTITGMRYSIHGAGRYGDRYGDEFVRRPRPEFDHVQHNQPNPILLRFRAEEDGSHNAALAYLALLNNEQGWRDHWGMLRYEWKAAGFDANFGPQAIDHARRVLTRLAALA